MSDPATQIFLELEIPGAGHAEVNAALLAIARSAFPHDRVLFRSATEHAAAVDRLLRDHSVDGVTVEGQRRLKPVSLRDEGALFGSLERRLRAGDVRRVVFCSTNRRRLAWTARLARRCPSVEVFALLHETIDTLSLGERRPSAWFARRFVYRDLPQNLTLLTHGRSLAESTARSLPSVRGSLAWMWLPYLYPPPPPPERRADGEPLLVVSFGVPKPMKGIGDFLRLAGNMHDRYGSRRVRFLILGRRAPGPDLVPEGGPVEYAGRGGGLSRAELGRRGRQAHWAVFPYRRESYAWRSSGAVHDALAYGVPILGYELSVLRDYFDAFGPLGELSESYEALEALVANLVEAPPGELHAAYRDNLRAAVRKLSPEALASQFARPTRVAAVPNAGADEPESAG